MALVAAALAALLTIVAFAVAHSSSDNSNANGLGGGQSYGSLPANRGSYHYTPPAGPTLPSPSTVPGVPSPPTTPSVPSDGTPTLENALVNAVLHEYFDGFQFHNLTRVINATCPKYRANLKGTYIEGKEVNGWRANYQITPGQNYVRVPITANLRNPSTGVNTPWNHTWDVERQGTTYYVCGYYY